MAGRLEGYITIRDLRLTLPLGLDAWGRPGKPQPVLVNVRLHHTNILPAAETDDCSKTVSYSDVAKAVIKAHESEPIGTPDAAVHDAHNRLSVASMAWQTSDEMVVETVLPKGNLRVEGGYAFKSVIRTADASFRESIDIFKDLKLACIIGVNAHEREQKQMVVVNLQLWRDLDREQIDVHRLTGDTMRGVIEAVEQSSFETVEALALSLSKRISEPLTWIKAIIKVEKPSAIALADGCGVELHHGYPKTE